MNLFSRMTLIPVSFRNQRKRSFCAFHMVSLYSKIFCIGISMNFVLLGFDCVVKHRFFSVCSAVSFLWERSNFFCHASKPSQLPMRLTFLWLLSLFGWPRNCNAAQTTICASLRVHFHNSFVEHPLVTALWSQCRTNKANRQEESSSKSRIHEITQKPLFLLPPFVQP